MCPVRVHAIPQIGRPHNLPGRVGRVAQKFAKEYYHHGDSLPSFSFVSLSRPVFLTPPAPSSSHCNNTCPPTRFSPLREGKGGVSRGECRPATPPPASLWWFWWSENASTSKPLVPLLVDTIYYSRPLLLILPIITGIPI